jgi:hypothetical protein
VADEGIVPVLERTKTLSERAAREFILGTAD